MAAVPGSCGARKMAHAVEGAWEHEKDMSFQFVGVLVASVGVDEWANGLASDMAKEVRWACLHDRGWAVEEAEYIAVAEPVGGEFRSAH